MNQTHYHPNEVQPAVNPKMSAAQAYIRHWHEGPYAADQIEIASLAVVEATIAVVESGLKQGADLFDALDAFALCPEEKQFNIALRMAIKQP